MTRKEFAEFIFEDSHLLCNPIKRAKKKRIAEGDTAFSKEQLDSYSKRYNEILTCGYEQNKKTKGKYAKSEEKKLLNRLKKYNNKSGVINEAK